MSQAQFRYIQNEKLTGLVEDWSKQRYEICVVCDPEYSKVVIMKPVQEEGDHRGKFSKGFKREGGPSWLKRIIKIEREPIRLQESYPMANPNSDNFCYIKNDYTNNNDNYNGNFYNGNNHFTPNNNNYI